MWVPEEKASPTKAALLTKGQPLSSADTARLTAPSTGVNPAAKDDRFGQAPTRFGKTIRIKGEMTGSEDVYVEGEVEGKVDLGDSALVVAPNGNVRAQMKAHSVNILGRLRGKVRAGERITVRKTTWLDADLATPRLVTEDGAVFRGSIDILEPEVSG
ncbi:MAG: polymer-forming cytoskeletal protein [Bryobacterales bacterium]|nr:polymer-forming cytoskeletal protein [Bryobacterales bacterium]